MASTFTTLPDDNRQSSYTSVLMSQPQVMEPSSPHSRELVDKFLPNDKGTDFCSRSGWVMKTRWTYTAIISPSRVMAINPMSSFSSKLQSSTSAERDATWKNCDGNSLHTTQLQVCYASPCLPGV